jgi:hypothetical protein
VDKPNIVGRSAPELVIALSRHGVVITARGWFPVSVVVAAIFLATLMTPQLHENFKREAWTAALQSARKLAVVVTPALPQASM